MEICSLEDLNINANIKAVIFDCFGTLMQSTARKKPYKIIIEYLKTQDYKSNNFATWLMTNPLTINDIEKYTSIVLPAQLIELFNNNMQEDLSSIKVYSEVKNVLLDLKQKQIKTMLCSNLAMPYGIEAKKLVTLDQYILSYECGFIKPQKEIYHLCQEKVMLKPEEIIFVGDNYKDDYEGARNFGFQSYWLNRVEKIPQ